MKNLVSILMVVGINFLISFPARAQLSEGITLDYVAEDVEFSMIFRSQELLEFADADIASEFTEAFASTFGIDWGELDYCFLQYSTQLGPMPSGEAPMFSLCFESNKRLDAEIVGESKFWDQMGLKPLELDELTVYGEESDSGPCILFPTDSMLILSTREGIENLAANQSDSTIEAISVLGTGWAIGGHFQKIGDGESALLLWKEIFGETPQNELIEDLVRACDQMTYKISQSNGLEIELQLTDGVDAEEFSGEIQSEIDLLIEELENAEPLVSDNVLRLFQSTRKLLEQSRISVFGDTVSLRTASEDGVQQSLEYLMLVFTEFMIQLFG